MASDICFMRESTADGDVPLRFSTTKVCTGELLALQRLILLVMNGKKYPVNGTAGVSLADILAGEVGNNTEFIEDLSELAAQHAADVINSVDSELRELVKDIRVNVRRDADPTQSAITFTMQTFKGNELTVTLPILPTEL